MTTIIKGLTIIGVISVCLILAGCLEDQTPDRSWDTDQNDVVYKNTQSVPVGYGVIGAFTKNGKGSKTVSVN